MYITDFLQFQGTFKCYRVVISSTQIQEVPCVCENLTYVLYLVTLFQEFLHLLRNTVQFANHLLKSLLLDISTNLTQSQCKHSEYSHLSGKCLRTCNTDFRTHVYVASRMCSSWNTAADGITYTVDERTFLSCQFYGSQCIGSLTALTDGYHHVVTVDYRIPVSEFTCIFHLTRYSAEVLNQLLTYQSGMPARSASHNDDTSCIHQFLLVVDYRTQHHIICFHIHTSTHAVHQTVRLFENLLQHEMRETALLNLLQVQFHLNHVVLHLLVIEIHDLHIVSAFDDGNILIVEINHFLCVFDDRTGIRTDEELILTYTYNQRTRFPCSYNLVGIVLVKYGNGIRTDHRSQCHSHGTEQIHILRCLYIFDKLNQHLSVGIALKLHTFLYQLLLQYGIVLDYTIMNDSQVPTLTYVRVSIHTVRFTVRCPTGMSNTYTSAYVLVFSVSLKVTHLSFSLIYIQFSVIIQQSHTGTVIATVLQSFQTVNQNRVGLLPTNVSYNSTHNLFLLILVSRDKGTAKMRNTNKKVSNISPYAHFLSSISVLCFQIINYRANRTQSSVLELLRCSRYSRQSRNGKWSMVNGQLLKTGVRMPY